MKFILGLVEIVMLPFTVLSAMWLKLIRRYFIKFWNDNTIITKSILLKIGVFPIIDHYYEPLFNTKHLKYSLRKNRNLPGINFNVEEQLSILNTFSYSSELTEINNRKKDTLTYSMHAGPFGSGDSDYLYSFVRRYKPSKVIEVGSGHSSLLIQHAIDKNKQEDSAYACTHICIEPFEIPWLEKLPVKVERKLVEDFDVDYFKQLKANDILFIDSSHMIRPQGDVLYEYLQIFPLLNSGVLVHIHDIFSPKDYLDKWLEEGKVFWNEQYLLEAFLSNNNDFKIVGAVNYLKNNHFDLFSKKCPLVNEHREPGSFWMQRN